MAPRIRLRKLSLGLSRTARLIGVAAVLALLTSGCQTTYLDETQRLRRLWSQGHVDAASREATRQAEKRDRSADSVIWRLEQGTTLRAGQAFSESNQAFERAESQIDQYEEKPVVRLGHQAQAIFVNLAGLPYEGYAYDKIMLHTYKALNYLELGRPEKARVELNRTLQRQQEAVRLNAQRIEQAQQQAAKQRHEVSRIREDPGFRRDLRRNGVYPQEQRLKGYQDYVNPFSVFLDGLFFLASATDYSDLERAHQSFERVQGMVGDKQYIEKDLKLVERIMEGEEIPELTYVIFETGQAPIRDQIRLDIPFFIITEEVPYVGAAFPRMEFRDHYVSRLRVTGTDKTHSTALLADMDSIVAQDFENRLPVIITRTLVASAVKAATTYGLQEGFDAAGLPSILGAVIGAGYQMAVNAADLRTWTTLPKEFQYCRIATPPDRKLILDTVGGAESRKSVTIQEGRINVVHVRSISPGAPMQITQFQLR